MPGQWEFQIGPAGPLEVGDEVRGCAAQNVIWSSLLHRAQFPVYGCRRPLAALLYSLHAPPSPLLQCTSGEECVSTVDDCAAGAWMRGV